MNVVEVIPLARGSRVEILSYFSTEPVVVGSLVKIEVRKKKIWGMVASSKSAVDLKSEIKSANFALKKIGKIAKGAPFRPEFVAASKESAGYFATSLGAILASYLPAPISSVAEKLPELSEVTGEPKGNKVVAKYAVMDKDEDRFIEYRSVVRSELARRRSVLFLAPTTEDARIAEMRLSKGIGESCFLLTSELNQKEFSDRWIEATKTQKPILVVATPIAMALPRADWGAIIIERESSPSYRMMRRPAVDARFLAERYAENLGCPIFFGDLLLKTDTVSRWKNGELMEHRSLRLRSVSDAETSIVPMSKKAKISAGEKPNQKITPITKKSFTSISDELQNAIELCREESGRTFLFVARKGLAPILTCQDCGVAVSCNSCDRPVALYGEALGRTDKTPELRCKTCGATRIAEDSCKTCGSWRLIPLGIGTEAVAIEVKEKFPDAQIIIVDAEHQKTSALARKSVEKWLSSPGAILIGTEMAANLVREEYDCLGIVSVDALFAVPEYRMRERILAILLHLRQHARRRIIFQTRLSDLSLFKHAAFGNLADFYREELLERKELNFPPFGILIRISVAGRTKSEALNKVKSIASLLAPNEVHTYLGRESIGKGLVPAHAMLTLLRDEWPDPALAAKLKTLSPEYLVEVDSDSIL